MIDLGKIQYRVVVMDGSGRQYDIKDFVENLGWEDNENEISVRVSFTIRNDQTARGYLSGIIKPGSLIGIFATAGGRSEEVARGYVVSWNLSQQNSAHDLKCVAYDELYNLQKSQDNLFFPSGTGTQTAIQQILNEWGIPLGDYSGPNVSHGKLVFNNKYLSDVILELLDDATKKGESKCIIRAGIGCINIVPWGNNDAVYVFREDNTKSISESISTENLITRVKVVGQEDAEGKRSVEAMINGLTEYGTRQKIYIRGSDETPEDAKSAAQELLNEEGKITKDIKVQSPDVPFVRKGDRVYLMLGTSTGYFYVKGIRHDADTHTMTMDLKTEP